MANDGTVDELIDGLATLEMAPGSELVAAGLVAAYAKIPGGLTGDNPYPCLVHYRLGLGSRFEQVTAAGRQPGGVTVAGSRSRLHHVAATLLVGPRESRNPALIGILEAKVRPWIDLLDTFYYQHQTLQVGGEGLALQCLAVSSKPSVIRLGDRRHFGEEFHLVIETRPRVAPRA